MNYLGLLAVALGLGAFLLTYRRLARRAVRLRVAWCGVFGVLSLPALLFAGYYLHTLPEWAWFYSLRSWTGSEFLVIPLGCAGGAVASLLPRLLLGLPLFAYLAPALIPYTKPLFGPIPDAFFGERWRGNVCLQSTASTCGPASVCSVLKRLGLACSERTVARAAYSYSGGTEAWYLARYVRSRGLVARFDFRGTFSPEVGMPAVVGVRLWGAGHFVAVLGIEGDQVSVADPLYGEERVPLAEFRRRYQFTGFHMVIAKPGHRG